MVNPAPAVLPSNESDVRPWYRQLNGYHWLVLIVATMAWSFDCLNQQIFNLARTPAMSDLLSVSPDDPAVTYYGNLGTSMLLIGWATGGIFFGMMGDRVGRAKTLLIMILAYSLSTGLCGLSQSPWHYIVFAFITGMGAGGIFPVACTLVAESLPDRARPQALGMLQTFSAVGNVSAGLIWLLLVQAWSRHWIQRDWPWLFCVGIVPALLSVIVARKIREPEAWLKAHKEWKPGMRKAGSLVELLTDRRWGPRAAVGLCLAVSGVVGLWGIGVFSNDLTQSFIGRQYDERMRAQGQAASDLEFVSQVISHSKDQGHAMEQVKPKDLLGRFAKDEKHDHEDIDAKTMYEAALSLAAAGKTVSPESVLNELDRDDPDRKVQPLAESKADRLDREELLQPAGDTSVESHVERILARQRARLVESRSWAAVTLAMFNVGAFFGMYAFARVTQWIGRRATFALAFLAAGITTSLAFLFMSKPSDLFWMVPLMGAAQLAVFGGYAIYFPELFPTHLRSTGMSFCYNVGRYVAATGPVSIAYLKNQVFAHTTQPFRYAGVAMCACYLIGLVALLFAPETKGQPLPE
jgi:MFS family permease